MSDLTTLLLNIRRDMTRDDVETTKFVLAHRYKIGQGDLENIDLFQKIWEVLIGCGKIDMDNDQETCKFLKELFDPKYYKGSERLINHVRLYLNETVPESYDPLSTTPGVGQIPSRMDDNMLISFEYLSGKISRHWRKLFRKLGMMQEQIEHIERDALKDGKPTAEMIYGGLYDWYKANPDKTLDFLFDALVKAEMKLYKDELEEKFNSRGATMPMEAN